jgi:HEAT repeat protein
MKGKWLTVIVCILLLIFGIAAAALVHERAKIPELVEQMGSEDFPDAEDAMRELATIRAFARSRLMETLSAVLDPEDRTQTDLRRRRGAMVLGEIGNRSAIPVLETALGAFKSKHVRWNCIVALGKLRATETVPALMEIVRDTSADEIVRATAIRTLGSLEAADAVGTFITQLQQRPDVQQVYAERKEEERKAKESAEKAEKRKEYEDAGLPVPEELLEEEEAEEEKEITDADRPQLRIACCEALAAIGSKEAVDALHEAADKDYESEYAVRAAASIALADLAEPDDADTVAVLLQNLEDEKWDLDANDEDDDDDGDLRIAAAYALGRLGNRSDEVRNALKYSLQDKEYWVREAAANSIKQLGGRVESE